MKANKSAAIILYIATIFFWFSQVAYLPYVNPELNAMGATATFIGFVTGVYGFVQMVVRVPLGIVADKFNLQKTFICLGACLGGLSGLGMFITYSPGGFLFFRALSGVASSTWVCFTVMYSNYFDEKDGSRAVSSLALSLYIGRFIALIMVGVITEMLGARVSFLVGFIGGVIGFTISLFVKNVEANKAPLKMRDFLLVLTDRNLIVISGLAVITQVLVCSTVSSFSNIVAKNIGATNMDLANISIIAVVSVVAFSFFAGKFVIPRFGNKVVLFTGFLFMVLYCISIIFVKDIAGIYMVQVLAGAGEGLTMPLLTGLCIEGVSQDKKTTAMGFFQAIYGAGMAAGPMLMGVLVDEFQYTVAFGVMGLLAGVAVIGTYILVPAKN